LRELMTELMQLLTLMKEKGASDLHITTGARPRLRIAGNLTPVDDYRELSPEDTREICCGFMTEAQLRKFETQNELDISFGIQGLSRFRANIFMQRGAVAGTFREIPFEIKGLRELGIPDIVDDILKKKQGLILVTGPAGSGKSTTLASMIEQINMGREAHVITIEDPIEFLHSHKKCIINQRELDSDTHSFSSALNFVMRQDPDIVMISDLKDLPTVEAALNLAASGHLALASMHTNSAIQTIGRIVELYSHQNHDFARSLLAECLECIVSQRLLKKGNGGRVLACEVLIPTNSIRTLMKEGKTSQIYSIMQTARSGMMTLNHSLIELCKAGVITYDDALANSPAPEEIMSKLPRADAAAAIAKKLTQPNK
jgi:twitching motility protein PilT